VPRTNFLAAGLIVLILAASAIAVFASSAATSLQEVSEALTCQCGCGLTVANCNHPQCESSLPIRQQIEAMIAKGMNRQQIVALFRKQYGEKILSAPTAEGFNLLAWIIPFAAIFAGCFIIVGAVGRWRASASGEVSGSGLIHPDDPELRRQLERDLREHL
jgi:cytochrome c-type biogenesis protein CcmH